MENRTKLQLYFLVALRIIIGWHFLYEGISKLLTPNWTSAGFLSLSNWIFAPLFHWIAETPNVLQIVDFLNIWGLIFIGAGLFLGLFTRVAIFSGITLLTMYYLANPPFVGLDFGVPTEGSYLIVNKNLIEIVALIVLALFPTWKSVGLDKFIFREKAEHPRVWPLYNKTDRTNITEEAPVIQEEPIQRRELLKGLAGVPLMGVFGLSLYRQIQWKSWEEKNLVDANSSASAKSFNYSSLKELKQQVPVAKIKNNEFSRLILGGNLLSGFSHSRDLMYVSSLVKAYHQKDKIFSTLLLAEKCGINTLLTNPVLSSIINEYWKRGIGDIKFISDCAGLDYDDKGASATPFDKYLDRVKMAIDKGAIACYIQGETADYYMENGRVDDLEKVYRYVEDRGISVGIGSHRIETIKACVDHGFNPDFWMKTMHHHNYWSAAHPQWHDNMYCFKPDETIAYMESLPQPWIAFKVMAAGAIKPKEAFKYALESGADFICAGIYDFQMVEDANIFCDILDEGVQRKRKWMA